MIMFGYDVFGSPVRSFRSESAPTILVKIDTTASGYNKVKHQLPNWSGNTWTPYAPSWSSYKGKKAITDRVEGKTVGNYTYPKHCVLVHESNDPNVPVGTKYGSACPADITAKECPENSTIVDGLCECDSGFSLVNGICQPTETSGRSSTTTTQTCDDSNRETNSDGSCASSCKSGYVFDSANLCVPEDDDDDDEGLPWGTIGFFGGIGLLTLVALRS